MNNDGIDTTKIFSFKNILSNEEVKNINNEMESIFNRMEEIGDKLAGSSRSMGSGNPEYRALNSELRDLHLKYGELKAKLDLHNRNVKYFEASNNPATEDEWDELLNSLPLEFTFKDLEIEVESEETDEVSGYNPMTDTYSYTEYPARTGYIREWTMEIEPTEELVSRYLNKPVDQITSKDLASVNEEAYEEFILDDKECLDKVTEDALDKWDYDDVEWEEDDYDRY